MSGEQLMTGPDPVVREEPASRGCRDEYPRAAGAEVPAQDAGRAARGLDTSVPNVARIYDYLLGGKSNFRADRDAAEQVLREIPSSALSCRQNRAFLGRVVRALAEDAGIRQFIDIGCGLPAADSVHEIAQRAAPGARVACIDNDPVVISHAQHMLAAKSSGVIAVLADLRDPESITGSPRVRALIDFRQPVAILLFAVLHFVTDEEQPREALLHFADILAPGSRLAISHLTHEGVPPGQSLAAQKIYRSASAPIAPRSRDAILRLLTSLELAVPGLVDIDAWPQEPPEIGRRGPLAFYGGVARKT